MTMKSCPTSPLLKESKIDDSQARGPLSFMLNKETLRKFEIFNKESDEDFGENDVLDLLIKKNPYKYEDSFPSSNSMNFEA